MPKGDLNPGWGASKQKDNIMQDDCENFGFEMRIQWGICLNAGSNHETSLLMSILENMLSGTRGTRTSCCWKTSKPWIDIRPHRRCPNKLSENVLWNATRSFFLNMVGTC